MLSSTSERKMRVTRATLLALWLVLIVSLFYDPLTVMLTDPDNLASPFRIDPAAQVFVQGRALPVGPYPMGARIFWTMLIPLVPMFLMLFGHEAWRRICPLSLSTQLPQLLGFQVKTRLFNRKSGQTEKKVRIVEAGSAIARNLWFVQFGFLWCGITGRLLFINSDRTFLACFLLAIIGAAGVVGLFFGGKTWCNYLCPISPVQKIYTGPGGLLESKAYRAKGVSQSTCRKPDTGGDQSTCVGCIASCPDKDLERSYWDNIDKPGKRFAYYGYFGLVLGFYCYYYLYSGNWAYYFSGSWTHEDGTLGTLFSPGLYIAGAAIPIPKLLAAPLTTGTFVLLSYGLGVVLERAYGRVRVLVNKPLGAEALRHHGLTFSAFTTFNVFYAFGGRPNLLLLPPILLRGVDVLIVLASTLWLSRALSCGSATYRRESLAQSMLRQLGRLKMDFSTILEGRRLEELTADEVYTLSKTLSGLPDDKKESLYRSVLREALTSGEVSKESSLDAMTEIRRQMNIGEDEHHLALDELLRREPGIDPKVAGEPNRVRLANYKLALENVVRRCLDSGRPVREELGATRNDREIRNLREIFDISEREHAEILSALLRESNVALREAHELADEIAEITCRIRTLGASGGSFRRGESDLLLHHLELRSRGLCVRFINVLASIPEAEEAARLARRLNVAAGGKARELLDAGGDGVDDGQRDRLPPAVLAALREDTGRSAEILRAEAPGELAALEAVLAARPQATECLEQMARGAEPVSAAIALSRLDRLDPERGRAVAESIGSTAPEHWLRSDVVRSVASRSDPAPADAARRETRSGEAGDYRIEDADPLSKMVHLFRSSFFRHLDLEALALIARKAEVRIYGPGGVVCRQGERSDGIYVVCRGSADVSIEKDGRSTWINVVGEGDSIGELGVFTRHPRSATVTANREETTIISVDEGALLSVLNHNARAAMSFVRLLSARQQGMIARL